MNKKLITFLLASFLVATLQLNTAVADNIPVSVGGPRITSGLTTGDRLQVSLDVGRSISCSLVPARNGVIATAGQGAIGFLPTVSSGPQAGPAGTLNGHLAPQITAGGTDTDNRNNRISFTATSGGLHFFDLDIAGGSGAGSTTAPGASSILVNFGCEDTTLFGAFNTNANPFNFLEIENVTTGDVEITVTLINFDDSFQAPTGQFNTLLAPSSRSDFSVHDLVGPLRFGSVVISHNGPSGAIRGRVSQYRISAAGALDLSTSVALSSN